jgi:hypothetical protein
MSPFSAHCIVMWYVLSQPWCALWRVPSLLFSFYIQWSGIIVCVL